MANVIVSLAFGNKLICFDFYSRTASATACALRFCISTDFDKVTLFVLDVVDISFNRALDNENILDIWSLTRPFSMITSSSFTAKAFAKSVQDIYFASTVIIWKI
jgi:hypothetical protein